MRSLRRALFIVALLLAVTSIAGAAQLSLSWTDNANNETGFILERCAGDPQAQCSTFAQIATLPSVAAPAPTIVYYVDKNLPENATFCYRVRATGASGASDYSNVACAATRLNAPTGLTVTAP